MQPRKKSSLSPAQAQLVECMQRLYYGRIERLVVRGGQPVMDPPPRVVRDVKINGKNRPGMKVHRQDFMLKAEVRKFLSNLEAIGNGTIRNVEVKDGLPFRMEIEE